MFTKSSHAVRGAAAALALALALGLTGCGAAGQIVHEVAKQHSSSPSADSSAALKRIVAGAQSSVAELESQGTYDKVTIEASGDSTIVYTYRYKKAIDPAAASAYFDSHLSTFQKSLDDQVFPAMKSGGVPAPKATYTYLNPDDSVVWTHTFQPS